jgi:crossover junction endodeoxyribonuclease RusA
MAIGGKGKQFRQETIYLCGRQVAIADRFGAGKRLHVSIAAFTPDRRTRDLDNTAKGILDSLTHAGVYADDSQIDHLEFIRKSVQNKNGRVIVTIEEIE